MDPQSCGHRQDVGQEADKDFRATAGNRASDKSCHSHGRQRDDELGHLHHDSGTTFNEGQHPGPSLFLDQQQENPKEYGKEDNSEHIERCRRLHNVVRNHGRDDIPEGIWQLRLYCLGRYLNICPSPWTDNIHESQAGDNRKQTGADIPCSRLDPNPSQPFSFLHPYDPQNKGEENERNNNHLQEIHEDKGKPL